MAKEYKTPATKIGTVGGFDIMDINGTACIVIGKTWLSVNKIKKVLANEGPCKEFVEKYEKPKEEKKRASAYLTTPSGNKVTVDQFNALVSARVQQALAQGKQNATA